MSDSERPDVTAFRELEHLVRGLGDELASFRRRALQAEARVRELEAGGTAGGTAGGDRGVNVAKLRKENEMLRKRLEAASTRTRQMLDRMRFLRQQSEREVGR